MKAKYIFLFLVVVLILGSAVSAETISGSLSSATFDTRTETGTGVSPGFGAPNISRWYTSQIEVLRGFELATFEPNNVFLTFDAGSPSSAFTTFSATSLAHPEKGILFTGYIGYSRAYNFAGVEISQYMYIQPDLSSPVTMEDLSGPDYVVFDFSKTALYNISVSDFNSEGLCGTTAGILCLGNGLRGFPGTYRTNIRQFFANNYTVSSPAGIGITGTVSKTINGTLQPSRIFVVNNTNKQILVSEPAISEDDFVFQVLQNAIYISALTPRPEYVNSSVMFALPSPTITPTPTPTGPPAGYIRTYAQNVDGVTSGQIHNSNILLRDVENNTWANWTNDSDGTGHIDTYSSHTIDAYGTATGYTSSSRLSLAPVDGVYELILFPTNYFLDPGTGNVNLIVLVNDLQTSNPLTYAPVSVTIQSGATIGGSTGAAGTETFVVPNNSVVYVTASKIGYVSGSKTITTSNFGPDTIRIELSKATVTPTITSTIPPGGVTPAITVDPNDPSLHGGDTSFKAQEMMNWLAMNGMQLVQLCFLVTILALLGVKLGGR
jgi:hypothetical protein